MMAAVAVQMPVNNTFNSVLLQHFHKAAPLPLIIGGGKVHHNRKVIIPFINRTVQRKFKPTQLTPVELFILRGIATVIGTGPALGSAYRLIPIGVKAAFYLSLIHI